jgi:hypothetical protein
MLAMLDTISAATIDRLLKPIRAKVGGKGLSGIKPETLLKKGGFKNQPQS